MCPKHFSWQKNARFLLKEELSSNWSFEKRLMSSTSCELWLLGKLLSMLALIDATGHCNYQQMGLSFTSLGWEMKMARRISMDHRLLTVISLKEMCFSLQANFLNRSLIHLQNFSMVFLRSSLRRWERGWIRTYILVGDEFSFQFVPLWLIIAYFHNNFRLQLFLTH